VLIIGTAQRTPGAAEQEAVAIISTQISLAPNQPTCSPRSSSNCSEPMPTAHCTEGGGGQNR
jgi:hypothetical protein